MLVTLDFETFYDVDYTLKKLSTSEYVRDARFEAINCSLMVDDGAAEVLWGRDAIADRLSELDPAEVELLAHHAHFEGLILSHHFGFVPRTYRDTLSMARGIFPKTEKNSLEVVAQRLGVANKLAMPDFKGKHLADFTPELRESVGEYVKGDVVACFQSYVKMLPMLPPAELDLIDITVRMFADPAMRLDCPKVEQELASERLEKGALILASGVPEDVLQSSAKLAKALQACDILVPQKRSPKTGKMAWAMAQTDLEFTALQRHPDPRVAALVKGRLAAKSTIGESRAVRLLRSGSNGLRLPVYLNYCGAHTTRWSGGDKLNYQNLPRKEFDPKGNELPRSAALRKTLLAPEGQVLVVVDSSQIEVRVLAWLAGEGWLLDAFANKDDPYCIFGTRAYGRTVTKGTDERQLAKICVLALGYGMGAWKLQQNFANGVNGPAIDLPMEVCEGFVRTYRSSSRCITGLWELMSGAINDMARGKEGTHKALSWEKDKILLPNGMVLHYPGTRTVVEQQRLGTMFGNRLEERVVDASYQGARSRQKLYGGLATENVVQALARVIVAEQMRQIARRYRVVMMSHDEVVFLADEAGADEALEFGLREMRVRPQWAQSIPLDAEGGYAANYSK